MTAVTAHVGAAVLAAGPSSGAESGGESDTAKAPEVFKEAFENLSQGILFVTMLIFLGGTFFMTQKSRIPLPYTVILFLYGILVGAVTLWVYPDVANALGSIPPELLFYIFLPVLIFEGSYAMNIHALRRVFPQVVLLATVGLLINTGLLALPIKLCFGSWSWYTALLLGSLLSATDPVAVVALLRDLGVDKCMTAMVDGESVMNDGTAIILFHFLLPAARDGGIHQSIGRMCVDCVRLSALPILLGPIFGFLQSFWLRRTGDGLTKACITVSVTYVSYYIAAHLIGASGVLTLFFQGIFLSFYCPSLFPGREGNLISSTWEFLVHLGNTVLFSLVGVILVADVIPTVQLSDIFLLLEIYLAMIAARWIMLEALSPCLNLFSYKVNQRRITLLVHAGLRGGVAATLALAVKQEGLKEGVLILKVTSGIVLLTLLVNATTAARVVALLGFNTKEEFRMLKMNFAMECVRTAQENALEKVKRDTKYRNASWMQVEKFVRKHIRNPYRGLGMERETDEDKTVNRMLMSVFKTVVWRQRDEEVITETVVMQLGAAIAGLMERGELLDVQQMHWFHRRKRTGGNDGTAGDGRAAGSEMADASFHTAPMSPLPRRQHTQVELVNRLTPEQQQQLGRPRFSTANTTTNTVGSAASQRGQDVTNKAAGTYSNAHETNTHNNNTSTAGAATTSVTTATASGTSLHKPRQDMLAQCINSGGYSAGTADMVGPMFDMAEEDPTFCETVRVDVTSLPPGLLEGGHDGAGGGAEAARMNRMVESLMRRLLPTWVVWAERFIFRKGYFKQAHRRAQENAFVTLLAVVKCLTVISPLKFKYVTSEEQAARVERWMTDQIIAANRAIRFFYANFPEATNNVASSRAVVSVANALQETVEVLHSEQGFSTHGAAVLAEMVAHMRAHVPTRWENNAEQKESNLVLRAVATSTLGKGLRTVEVKAISSMGLVRKFREGDIIALPDNAFLVVVSGSLRAMHGQWTTLTQHEMMESYGDTVGLEALMLPPEFRVAQQRRWRVISTESTALLISFNSIRPFLMERSIRAVKALWRAAAVEVLVPFLSRIVTVPENQMQTKREHLIELILAGTPLIGPRDCDLASCETKFHLYFYLRGTDKSGLFSSHTPPCAISTFYVHQLRWTAPDAVLYAVPMRVGDRGYVPWAEAASGPSAISGAVSPSIMSDDEDSRPFAVADEDARGGSGGGNSHESGSEVAVRTAFGQQQRLSPARSRSFSGADAASMPATTTPRTRSPGAVSTPSELPATATPSSAAAFPQRHLTADDLLPFATPRARGLPTPLPLPLARPNIAPVSSGTALDSPSVPTLQSPSGQNSAQNPHNTASFTSSILERGSVTPFLAAAPYGDNATTATTHVEATSIINNVLLGTIPQEAAEGYFRTGSVSVFGDLLDTLSSPLLGQRDTEGFLTSPCVSEQQSHAASTYHCYPDSADISIFYSLEKFVTPVPFANQIFVHYASALEHLCIATLRYLRFPADPFHVQHAQVTGEQTVEFLLEFCVELSVLKRTCRVVSKRHSEATDVMNPFHASNDIDSALQAKVCTWASQYRVNGKFHLKMMVTEMNKFANHRFPDYVALLRRMVELEPELKSVETAEGLNKLCRRIVGIEETKMAAAGGGDGGGGGGAAEATTVKLESLEDAL